MVDLGPITPFEQENKIFIHVPDPINLGKFIVYEHTNTPTHIPCQWCKTKYKTNQQSNCPNCGGNN